MKKIISLYIIGISAMFFAPQAFAATTAPIAPQNFLGLPQFTVDWIVGLLAGQLVRPLTAILKNLGDTSGITTQAIVIVLSAILAGASQLASGQINVFNFLATTVTAIATAFGTHQANKDAAKKPG